MKMELQSFNPQRASATFLLYLVCTETIKRFRAIGTCIMQLRTGIKMRFDLIGSLKCKGFKMAPRLTQMTDDDRQMDWIRDLADVRGPKKQGPILVGLVMYTVYFNPSDYPGKFVVRSLVVKAGGVVPQDECIVGNSLDEVRSFIPPELFRLPRDDNDESSIVEIWI